MYRYIYVFLYACFSSAGAFTGTASDVRTTSKGRAMKADHWPCFTDQQVAHDGHRFVGVLHRMGRRDRTSLDAAALSRACFSFPPLSLSLSFGGRRRCRARKRKKNRKKIKSGDAANFKPRPTDQWAEDSDRRLWWGRRKNNGGRGHRWLEPHHCPFLSWKYHNKHGHSPRDGGRNRSAIDVMRGLISWDAIPYQGNVVFIRSWSPHFSSLYFALKWHESVEIQVERGIRKLSRQRGCAWLIHWRSGYFGRYFRLPNNFSSFFLHCSIKIR